MFGYTVNQWLFFFYFYCFFGWVFESTYVSIKSRRFINRGFMHGPFLPLYGTGAIMMLVLSRPFADNLILTYIAGCIGATLLEYLTAAWMEALFKVRYWDYSDKRFNVKGYICLGSTLAWGVLTVLMTRVIHTPVEQFVLSIPTEALSAVVSVLTVYIGVDLALSFRAAFDLRDMLVKLEKARQDAAQLQEKLSQAMAMAGEQFEEKKEKYAPDLDALRDALKKRGMDLDPLFERMEATRRQYADLRERIKEMSLHPLKHNPTLSSDRFREALKELREEIRRNDEEQSK